MDFALTEEQEALQASLTTLLSRFAGPARARELEASGGADEALWAALDRAGFLDVARDDDPVTAALVIEGVAVAAGVAPVGARALVAPAVMSPAPTGPVALVSAGAEAPVRFGAEAGSVLIVGEDDVRVRALAPGEAQSVPSRFGYPFARVPTDGGDSLGPGTADVARRWWRVAIAAEIVGTMAAALRHTTEYLSARHQFGRSIASYQAVQHRLAEATVSIEGARWLTRRAAWSDASAEDAAAAASFATDAAKRLGPELHQLNGAIGFALETDLHVWTMRLPALCHDLDGTAGHARAVAQARWPA
jgi:alkylation response protein AidB-like acyl-CoA dehydrogenase